LRALTENFLRVKYKIPDELDVDTVVKILAQIADGAARLADHGGCRMSGSAAKQASVSTASREPSPLPG